VPPSGLADLEFLLSLVEGLNGFSSEEKDHPIESALIAGESKGWRASGPGSHVIQLIFDRPQRLKRISLVFEEKETSRTQEIVLRWSHDREGPCER
jgi:hypothetical protein